jgi:hypothetical protein
MAPSMTASGARSPPMASTAMTVRDMRPRPRQVARVSLR